MKEFVLRILDTWIPSDIIEFEQQEELIRARAVVFILMISAIAAALGLLAKLIGSVVLLEVSALTPVTLVISLTGFGLALWLFRRFGLFLASANIYAVAAYIATLMTVVDLSRDNGVYLLLILLALPVIVSLIGNHLSAMVWFLIVAATPFYVAHRGNTLIEGFFLFSWTVCCGGQLFALFMLHFYRESMRHRLNRERAQFEFAAAHDALTGLANRATFDRRLEECIECCALHDTKAVLLFIDLDKFKPINDSYGHQAGDIVLTTVASRLRQLVRRTDTVARLGGDEFAVLFDRCDPAAIQPIVDRMAAVIREPIQVFDNWLTVECSIGKVICPDDGLHPEQLSHKADERMYEAKQKAAN